MEPVQCAYTESTSVFEWDSAEAKQAIKIG